MKIFKYYTLDQGSKTYIRAFTFRTYFWKPPKENFERNLRLSADVETPCGPTGGAGGGD